MPGTHATAVHRCLHGSGVQEQKLHPAASQRITGSNHSFELPREKPLRSCNGNSTGISNTTCPVKSRGTQGRETRLTPAALGAHGEGRRERERSCSVRAQQQQQEWLSEVTSTFPLLPVKQARHSSLALAPPVLL